MRIKDEYIKLTIFITTEHDDKKIDLILNL